MAVQPSSSAEPALTTVLVVGLHPTADQAIVTCLNHDFRVVVISDVDASIRSIQVLTPALVVCDLSACTSQGTTFVEAIRQNNKFDPMPIIILANAVDEDLQAYLEHDTVQDYLVRPFQPAELLIRSKKLLALKRSTDLLAHQARERASLLEESENRFRLMVESIEDYAMFIISLSGHIITWNRGAERLTGYTESEALGRHFSILYPREALDATHAEQELRTAAKQGRYEEEGVRVRKDGSTYDAQITVWRIDDDEGKAVGFAKITRDVTARHQAQEREAKLLESENRFRLMVESIQDYAMFMVDPKGTITSWNRGAERLTGYREIEALGQHFSILYPREDLDAEHATFELAMARQHGRHEEEGIRVRKDGSSYYAQIVIWPMKDRLGDIVGFAKITRDVTAHRLAEQALRDSERKFRTITDAMPQMVWSTQANGDHDYFNEQWYRFTGVPEGSTHGNAWNHLLHPDDQPRARRVWQQSLNTGRTYEIQYRLRHHTGAYRWTLGRALPVRNDHGEIVRWMGTLTDIDDQKQAEEALRDADRRKDEFLAMLAHELRNPLAPIRNSTLLLQQFATADERATQALNVIERQVRHMSCLIDDLLDVARISRGKIKIRQEAVDLIEVVRHTIEDFEADYQARGVELTMDIAGWSLWIRGDRTRIAQVIGNLLHNALKFTDSGGRVAVEVNREDDEPGGTAVIRVADSGVGLEPGLTQDLFNPFIQANQGLARSKGGLGLGLALVKGFVELHGGSVAVHSEGLGRGSVFCLRLPLIPSPQQHQKQVESRQPTQRLRILLIDDNRDMVETLGALLAFEGHEILKAYDGDSGIDMIRAERPDLVLCDIGLPGAKDGYAVARDTRADPAIADTFLVALSGYGQEQDRQRARESGFMEHLLKPLEFSELLKVIAQASRTRKSSPINIMGH